jgi:hypothetical protein
MSANDPKRIVATQNDGRTSFRRPKIPAVIASYSHDGRDEKSHAVLHKGFCERCFAVRLTITSSVIGDYA